MHIRGSMVKVLIAVWMVMCISIIAVKDGFPNALDAFNGNTYTPQTIYGFKDVPYSTANKFWLAGFITSQAMDIISTQYALDNGCEEVNPIYGKDPSVMTMVLVKTGFSIIAYSIIEYMSPSEVLQRNRNWWYGSITMVSTAVVINNYSEANK